MSVYTWGSGKSGALDNHSSALTACWEPKILESLQAVPVSIAAGEGHTLIATDSGDCFAFGRKNQGQCTDKSAFPLPVQYLQHESVIKVEAGATCSYALTASGRIYQFGFVHIPQNNIISNETQESNHLAGVTSGQLTGLAQDQQSIQVPVDVEARRSAVNSNNLAYSGSRYRQLGDIVQKSTQRWLISNDEAEEEYFKELRAIGYEKEEAEERIQERGREYHGMLQLGCSRKPQFSPEVISFSGLSKVSIVDISAGHAHCLLLSSCGRLFASGYNDRGQLGLGHRISTSEFKPVDYLENKFVLQVSCGQQHTLARVIDRNLALDLTNYSPSSYASNSMGTRIAGDVFVWGNGILGQLGIGRRGTSKGRLLPTLLKALQTHDLRDNSGIISVSCGDNFSVAVTGSGKVFSWGHSEYNQHGQGSTATGDYSDPYYYFTPRMINGIQELFHENYLTNKPEERIVSVSCGSTFTLALSDRGRVVSWGWGAHGVLGRGTILSSEPGFVHNLGPVFREDGKVEESDRVVCQIAAGASHAIAITIPKGNQWANNYRSLLPSLPIVTNTSSTPLTSLSLQNNFNHVMSKLQPRQIESSSLLSNKSTTGLICNYYGDRDTSDVEIYLDGYENDVFCAHRAILLARSSYLRGFILAAHNDYLQQQSCQSEDIKSSDLVIHLPETEFTSPYSVQKVLEYLYCDRVSVLPHRKNYVISLARAFCTEELLNILSGDNTTSNAFEKDLQNAVNNAAYLPNVFFYRVNEVQKREVVLRAHSVILAHFMPYFHTLFHGNFIESGLTSGGNDESSVVGYGYWLSISSFEEDGLTIEILHRLLLFAYSGSYVMIDCYRGELHKGLLDSEHIHNNDISMNDIMLLLVTSQRFGFTALTQCCERQLVSHLSDFPENARNCADFAAMFNLPRLEQQCLSMLNVGSKLP